MIRLFSTKSLIASAIALGAVVAGSAAHARSDVTLVVDLNSPHRYVRPAPVLVQHQQISLQPRTIHTQPQTGQFGHDRDRFDRYDRYDHRGGALGDADRDSIPNKFDRNSRFYDARATQRHAQGNRHLRLLTSQP